MAEKMNTLVCCFLAMLLLATDASNTNPMKTPAAAVDSVNAASLRKGISGGMFAARKEGAWIMGKNLGMSMSRNMTSGSMIKSTKEDEHVGVEHVGGRSGPIRGGRRFRICLTRNHCYKKRLVCPRRCKRAPPPNLISNHFPGQCVLNCRRCIAHC